MTGSAAKSCGIIYDTAQLKKSKPGMLQPSPAIPRYRRAEFLTSASRLSQCPPDSGWEVAFAGRSNTGKSSAINTLTDQRKLARTSATPGRTQLINFFSLSAQQRLVDLPGYGFAKVPAAIKRAWTRQLECYLQERKCLRGMILLMDIRRPLQEIDHTLLNWAAAADMPVHVLLTKADKLARGPARSTLLQVQAALATARSPVSLQLFSATKKTGLAELCSVLDHWLTDVSVL